MRSMRLSRPGTADTNPLELVESSDLRPDPGELTIRVNACAVCRTDLQIIEGDLEAQRLPIVPGHQVVGTVAEVGAGVGGWALGDRVGVGWMAGTCGECRFCTSERENLCPYARHTGWTRDGGFAELVNVRADFALRITSEHSDRDLAPLLCGGVIGYRSLKVSGIDPGGKLGLFGFGASASLTIQIAVGWGCDVFVFTRSETERRRATDMGAVWAGGYEDKAPILLDAAITFAPVGSVVVQALQSLERGAVVAINAIHLDEMPAFDYGDLWHERQIRSVANYTRADAIEFLELTSRLPVRTSAQTFDLERANDALADLRVGNIAGAAVLVND